MYSMPFHIVLGTVVQLKWNVKVSYPDTRCVARCFDHLEAMERIAKTQLLIIDDIGLTHLEPQQRMELMEIIEDRHAKNATIIASQLPINNWYEVIGEPTIADAILDRLIHTAHRVELKGDSLRKKCNFVRLRRSQCLFSSWGAVSPEYPIMG